MVSLSKKNYKCFIGYKDVDHKITTIPIMLPKTSAYAKSNDAFEGIYFLLKW